MSSEGGLMVEAHLGEVRAESAVLLDSIRQACSPFKIVEKAILLFSVTHC